MERDGGTGAFVAWWRNLQQLYLQRVTSSGVPEAGWPAGGKFLLNDSRCALFRTPVLADGSGGVLVLANGCAGLRLFRVHATGATPAGWDANGLDLDFGVATTADLVRADATHVFAVWTVDGHVTSQRIPIAGSGAAGWPGAPLELFSAEQGASGLDLVPDGAGGLHALCRTADDGARWQHVTAEGELAPGFPAGGLSPLDEAAVLDPASWSLGSRMFGAAGRDGGLIACRHDLRAGGAGTRARWLRADGTADPTEPAEARLVVADAAPLTAYVRGALDDGNGGAYVLWSNQAELPYYDTAYLMRAYSSTVLAVEPRAASLALALSPNPARGALTASFTLPRDGVARLSMHDVAGRLVASREVAGAGPHVERFDGLDALAPGVCLVTLAHGADSRRARVAVIR